MKTLAHHPEKTEIFRRLKTLRADSVGRWGRMSVHQMVCHLADSCRMALGHKLPTHSPKLFQRTIVKWVALYAPLRWPAGVPTIPEVDQEVDGTRPADFASDVAELEALLELTTQSADAPLHPHPIFGRMSRAAWLRWGFLHADHHLRQFGA